MTRHPLRLAAPALALCIALAGGASWAQPTPATARPIAVPAQPLGDALNALARQFSMPVAAPQALIAGRIAPAVQGLLTAREAVDRLLVGSGLVAEQGGNAFVIRQATPTALPAPAAQLQAVTVTASADRAGAPPAPYAGGQVARGGRMGLLGQADFMDTPFNLTAFTAELIENQQARNIVDVLANDPGAQAGGPRTFDNFYIRGFAVNREEIGFDGLYGIASAEGNLLEGVERVEVLKGPSTLLHGSAPKGTSGGAINLVPKRAGATPLTRFSGSHFGDGNLGGHLDLGRRFGPDQSVGVRLNAALRDGDTAADHESERARNLTLGLDYRGERVRLSADLGDSHTRTDGARSNFYVTAPKLPGAPAGGTNVWPAWTFQDKKHRFGVLRGEFDLSDRATASLAIGRATSERRMLEAFSILADADGTLNAFGSALHERHERRAAEASVRWSFDTGPVRHQLALAGTQYRSDVTNFQPSIDYAFSSDLYRPTTPAAPGGDLLAAPLVQLSRTRMDSLAVADTLSLLDDRLRLTLGLRRQKIRVDAHHYATGAFESRYERSETTPAGAALFRVADAMSLYANYVEALSQGVTAPSTAVNANEVFPPFVSRQGELGVKVDHGRLATTLSLFQIRRPSGLLDAGNRYRVDGEQRNRGVELQTFGELLPRWRVLGGATWTQAKLTRTQDGLNDGRQAAGAPRWLLKLGSEWDLTGVPGLTATARVIHTAAQPLTVDNSVRVPGWTRLDVGARYATRLGDRPLVLRASVENLTNRSYWDSVPAFQVVTYAAPRTVLLSATVDF